VRKFLAARSKLGLVLAILDFIYGLAFVLGERYGGNSGSFIDLRGIATAVGTAPTSILIDKLFPSLGLDSSSFYDTPYTWTTTAVITMLLTLNFALIYAVGAGLGKFWGYFSNTGKKAD